jgi:hypothetical protein
VSAPPRQWTEEEVLSTPLGFAEGILGIELYRWQKKAITWFDGCEGKRVKGSLLTPNGAGKDAMVIATLALWWIYVHPRGRVVITSKDARQIDEQTWPALERHRGKFPSSWKWIEREIETPTGGKIILFTTDSPGRVEGFHREVGGDGKPTNLGPLLLVANEAKSIDEGILTALDRCTYDGLLYASSAGTMFGRFYESQTFPEMGFKRLSVGLFECPHITQDRIDDIIATYGPNSARPNPEFIESTLYGKFMAGEAELRFNRDGLRRLTEMSAAYEADHKARRGCPTGTIEEQLPSKALTWMADPQTGWAWRCEEPTPGCRYIGFGDPMTGAQSEGSLNRDTHGFGILRLAYRDSSCIERDDEVVAVLHAPSGVRWDNDIVAQRFSRLLRLYGDCIAILEANNAGVEVLRLLQLDGRRLWLREKRDHRVPGKKLDVVGFQTTAASKSLWVGALAIAIREQTLDCRYGPACQQFSTFLLNENGNGEAQRGCHDDFVTGVGLALYARLAAAVLPMRPLFNVPRERVGGAWS